MSEVVLDVKNLNVFYGAIHAVKNLSFQVHRGEIVSLIGANGAGKTTTLRAVSGVLPYQGSVRAGNTELNTIAPHDVVRAGISHCPEGRGIFQNLTVLENLELGAYFRNDAKNIELDLEECFYLFPRVKERLHQLAGTLSGGEQQMVAICRALMARPKILMLDEPSLGLAPMVVSQIFEIVQKLNQTEKMTILLVEQNARMALKISHRAYVIETGEISLTGTGPELANNDSVRRSYLGG
jgi:branched-chain amino acid transport system ATP-binding protein